MKKRSANLEIIIDALENGKSKKPRYLCSSSLGLPYVVGKALLESLVETGLMEADIDNKLSTSEKGLEYLKDLGELNRRSGMDSVLNSVSKSKKKYYESRKLAT